MLFSDLLGAAATGLASLNSLLAEAWPSYDQAFQRGPGYYLSLPKILFCWILFLIWVWSTDQASQDCQRQRLSYVLWNSVIFFPFVAAFVLVWLLPWFWFGAMLMIVAYVAPLATYVVFRNK